ncbi:CsgG/HfaB family protein [Deinococcus sp. MIMF12]|uniref:CsgG/HfaB family protein n=1 Tax=Deinococcus rhizophilus TaxID=3049544 RepID=A0ABT7JI50_9DEIO|nr:CsgG/HfaB family protein [Deinococcus rhizophilus]MDL2344165.1 CsgG/HfaB family protein [Deinococcus rhizophilus]
MKITRKPWWLLTAGVLALGSSSLAQSATLGVAYLNSNTPNPEAGWISRGLADMLTTDLSKISKLTVVQREQLDKVLKEQALGASGAVDPGKAAQLGKLLGVQTLLTGSYAAIGRNVRVDLQLINTSTGRVEGGVTAEGSIDSIFSLEKQLVLAVINKLGIMPSPAEMQAILQPETLNNQAIVLNYQALAQLQTNPKAATTTLQKAVALDPNYASAQQNLRTALSLSGNSIANTAMLDIDLKSKEIQAVRQAAEVIKKGVRIFDVKLDEPTTEASSPEMVSIDYSFKVQLETGTLAAVAKLLEPFSREGKGRSPLVLESPGLGRGDQKNITLSDDSIAFLVEYLKGIVLRHAFYGTGKHPIYISQFYSGLGDITVASVAGIRGYNKILKEEAIEIEPDPLSMPISLLKNIITSSPLLVYNDQQRSGEETNFLYIDARNARELGVPQGYLRDSGIDGKECTASLKDGNYNLQYGTFDAYIPSANLIVKLSGACLIYTKINDSDFNPSRLSELLYSGEDFNVTVYQLDQKSAISRPRRDIARSDDVTFDYSRYGIKFNLTMPVMNEYAPRYFDIKLGSDGGNNAPKFEGFSVKPFF